MKNTNPYDLLGIDPGGPDVTQQDIRDAWKALVKLYHSDVTDDASNEEKLRQVNAAYNILKDPETRAQIDSGDEWNWESGFAISQAIIKEGLNDIIIDMMASFVNSTSDAPFTFEKALKDLDFGEMLFRILQEKHFNVTAALTKQKKLLKGIEHTVKKLKPSPLVDPVFSHFQKQTAIITDNLSRIEIDKETIERMIELAKEIKFDKDTMFHSSYTYPTNTTYAKLIK